MSQDKEPPDPMEELKRNLDQAFKQGKSFFPMGGGFTPQSGVSSPSEKKEDSEVDEEDIPPATHGGERRR